MQRPDRAVMIAPDAAQHDAVHRLVGQRAQPFADLLRCPVTETFCSPDRRTCSRRSPTLEGREPDTATSARIHMRARRPRPSSRAALLERRQAVSVLDSAP